MCGIAGIYSMNGLPIRNAEDRICKMLTIQYNRGPDQHGFTFSEDKRLVIGNTRLSIVDINTFLPVPFVKEGSKDILSFNGEIFNYKELRKVLTKKGCIFKTESDTEVLFEALAKFDKNVYGWLSGMWGFAYYQNFERCLTLSRDALGERHIFYLIKNRELIFASDPKAIIAVTNNNTFNYKAVPSVWMYNSAPPNETLVKDIKRMLPGELITVKEGNIKIEIHSKLEPQKWNDFFNSDPTLDAVSTKFEDIFQRVIDERIPDEVKFVTTLSGGIDSAIVNFFMAKRKNNFDAIFGNSSFNKVLKNGDSLDESEAASYTARKIGVNLIKFDMLLDDPVNMLKYAASDCFDGCIDDGVVPFEMLARKAKELGSKVILISDGPDDFAGGYPIDQKLFQADKIYCGNNNLLKFGQFMSKYSPFKQLMSLVLGENAIISDDVSYLPFRSSVTHQLHKKNSLNPIFNNVMLENIYDDYGTLTDYNDGSELKDWSMKRALSYATKSTPDMFNLRVDKAFMKHSIEARLPFQDKKLVEFLVALPSWFRFKNGKETKYLLRQIVKKNIGKQISSRQKYGFAHHLWSDNNVFNSLRMKENIQKSELFKHEIFKKKALSHVFRNNAHKGLSWSAYSLAMTHDRLSSKDFCFKDK